ncbi:MAG: glycosyl hydrolase family 3 [Gemmatimonadota bacterium]|nr:glycosyl hydrolase family 3 [Gemmatimonadota bacterium]
MSEIAQLLLPALHWDPAHGYAGDRPMMERALELGVGGFILFGGSVGDARELTTELHRRSRVPLLVAADLERGAGQQFAGATGLPPLAAIASLADPDALRRAARLTAREARELGVNWDYAPVCDLDILPENPIVGTRAFGGDPEYVAALAADWIDACQSESVLACAKHFPGHGRTTGDSHMELPVVRSSAQELLATDLLPFRAAVDAGVASIMTAHVAYPALDPSGAPATLSREIIGRLLRQEMRYDGLIVSDSLTMEGALVGQNEAEAGIRALQAGCDLLLYPADLEAIARALEQALRDGVLESERIFHSLRRRARWAQWGALVSRPPQTPVVEPGWADELAVRCIHVVRGAPARVTSPLDIIVVDDDVGGPHPSRDPFFATLGAAGWDVRRVDKPAEDGRRSTIVALFGDIRSWKGRPGYSAHTRALVERAGHERGDVVVLQFGHPRLAAEIPRARTVVCAWGGEAAMQRAAAAWIVRGP